MVTASFLMQSTGGDTFDEDDSTIRVAKIEVQNSTLAKLDGTTEVLYDGEAKGFKFENIILYS